MKSARQRPTSRDGPRWRFVSLHEVASIDRISVQPREIAGQELYVGLENITGDGQFCGIGAACESRIRSSKFSFSHEHVLYGKLRPYLAKVAAPEFDGICSTDILPIRPGAELDRRYLTHYLRTPSMVTHATNNAVGINLPRLSPKMLELFEVPLPPIEEQRRIAAVLDAAEALRAKRRESLAKLDSLTQAVFIDMFGDQRKGESALLRQHVDLITKGTTPTSVGFNFTESGVPFVRVQDLVAGSVDVAGIALFIAEKTNEALRRSILKPDDVLVSIAGTIGRIALVPRDAPTLNCNQAVALIRTGRDLEPAYLASWLNTAHAQEQMLGSRVTGTISNLSLANIRSLRIPIPTIDLQRRFADAVGDTKLLRNSLVAHADSLDTLFASLQQRAFRGEL